MTAFPYGTGMCHTEIPGPPADPERKARRACPPGVCFFASFFAQAKKRSSTAEWLVKKAPAASGAMRDIKQTRTGRCTQQVHRAYAFSVNRG
jgi:hypothetical protein